MGEAEGSVALVFDANVIIAALISGKEGSINRTVVTLAPLIHPSYYPAVLKGEVMKEVPRIALKTGKGEEYVRSLFERIVSRLNLIDEGLLRPFTEESMSYVRDPSDSPYVAAALYIKRVLGFREVFIVTWNKKDFKCYDLAGLRIKVLTPKELFESRST